MLRLGGMSSGEGIGSKRTSGGNQFGLDFYTGSSNRLAITSGGNVGLGTTAPDASAALDIASTSRGVLLPRLTLAQRNAISNPAAGLVLLNTSSNRFNVWDGTAWTELVTAPANAVVSTTFAATGGVQAYTVPAGTTQLRVTAVGANGGGASRGGGQVTATISVTPGEVLNVYVGTRGGNGNSNGSAGGFNGGGATGGALAGGGGATDLRRGTALADRLVVAGGGGGGGAAYSSNAFGGAGGSPGVAGEGVGPGGGGTATAGGSGGSNTAPGQAGGLGTGGLGGGGANTNSGGGGGGGYYGGGGGGGSGVSRGDGSGGGGGSSWATPSATNVSYQTGGNGGPGSLTIVPLPEVVAAPAPALDGSNITNVPGAWDVSGTTYYYDRGSVGIGTSSPATTLDVRAGTPAITVADPNGQSGAVYLGNSGHGLRRNYNNGANDVGLYTTSGTVYLSANGSTATQVALLSNGNLGIGTSTPSAKLDVQGVGNVGTNNFVFYRNMNSAPNSGYATNNTNAVSIRASGPVMASEFYAISDRRFKTIVGRSDNARDLGLLTRLRITDYTMKDRVAFGDRAFKKVIAQEVEDVLPQAVTRQTGFLPDVYAPALAVAALPGDSLVQLTLPAGLPTGGATAGQRLRLLGEQHTVLAAVARPAAAGSRTLVVRGATELKGQPVFVYGLEHADVRAVDYEALSMLNVSATQELARKVEALEQQNAALQAGAAADHASLLTLQEQVARLLSEGTQARK